MPSAAQTKAALEMAKLVSNAVSNRAPARRGNPQPGRRQPTGRATRGTRRRAGALNMPSNALYQERNGKTDFSGATTKQLQQAAWKRNPATSDLMAPRGLGFYDAFNMNSSEAVTSMTVGPATAIQAMTTIPSISTGHVHSSENLFGTDRDAQLLIIGPARGAVQARLWRINGTNDAQSAARFDYSSPQLETDAPIDAIPVRCSVRIRNFTNNYNVGGLVRILRATTGRTMVPGLYSNGELQDLMDGIRNHARTTVMTGTEFQQTKQKNTVVCDQTRSLQFESFDKPYKLIGSRLIADFGGTNLDPAGVASVHATHEVDVANNSGGLNVGDIIDPSEGVVGGLIVNTEGPGPIVADQPVAPTGANWLTNHNNPNSLTHFFVDPFTDYCANPTFTPIFILFEPNYTQISGPYPMTSPLLGGVTALGNQYEVRIASQFLSHYRQGTILANMAKEHKASVEQVQKAKAKEDFFGSTFLPAVTAASQMLGVMF